MRKVLWVVAVGVLVLAMALPAMAVDIKFGGQTRVRFFDIANYGFDSNQTENPGNNPRGAEVRFRMRMDASDDNGNIVGTLRLRIGNLVYGAGGGTLNPNNTASPAGDLNALSSGAAVSTTNSGGVFSGTRTGSSAGGGLGSRGVNAETEWAYLDFQVPWGVPLRIRSGMIPWYLPKGMIIDDNVAGLQAYGNYGPVSYQAAWYRLNAGDRVASVYIRNNEVGLGEASRYQNGAIDDKYDVYEGKFNWNIVSWLNPGIYFDYGDNRANCVVDRSTGLQSGCPGQDRVRPNWFLGFTDTGTIGPVTYDFDFIYGWAKGGITGNFVQGVAPGTFGVVNGGLSTTLQSATGASLCTGVGPLGTTCPSAAAPITTEGWAIDGGVHFPIGPVKVNFVFAVASGDKQNGSSTSNAFPGGYGPNWMGPGSNGGYEILGGGGPWFDMVTTTQSSVTNLWTVGTWFQYFPVKALEMDAAWAYAGFYQKNGNCALFVPGSVGCYGPSYYGRGFVPNPAAPALPGLGAATVANGTLYTNQGTGGIAGQSGLGNEFSLRAIWQMYTGFKVIGVVGWFIPSKGDTMGKYGLSFQYDF